VAVSEVIEVAVEEVAVVVEVVIIIV